MALGSGFGMAMACLGLSVPPFFFPFPSFVIPFLVMGGVDWAYVGSLGGTWVVPII
jgi:hypothetical protein